MGFGVGISYWSTFKIATEKSIYSMPEAKFGWFCDVGSTYFLNNIRNKMGLY